MAEQGQVEPETRPTAILFSPSGRSFREHGRHFEGGGHVARVDPAVAIRVDRSSPPLGPNSMRSCSQHPYSETSAPLSCRLSLLLKAEYRIHNMVALALPS